MLIVLLVFGLVLLVLMMALVINPPEAWIKRVFHGKKTDPRPNVKPRP